MLKITLLTSVTLLSLIGCISPEEQLKRQEDYQRALKQREEKYQRESEEFTARVNVAIKSYPLVYYVESSQPMKVNYVNEDGTDVTEMASDGRWFKALKPKSGQSSSFYVTNGNYYKSTTGTDVKVYVFVNGKQYDYKAKLSPEPYFSVFTKHVNWR